MPERIFLRGDILIPRGDFESWSVIACDQFTAQPEYWKQAEALASGRPSTLSLIFPEAYLEEPGADKRVESIGESMANYLGQGVFRELQDSYVYIERRLSSGSIRRGLLGLLDLEHYDYKEGSNTLIHATEGTVEERLPARVEVREKALLELPHVVVFIDDPEYTVIDPVLNGDSNPEKIYDFDLMQGGGHIIGWRIAGERAGNIEKALLALEDPEIISAKYNIPGRPPIAYAVGDGNHSLAAARLCWERVRDGLTAEERENHPARYSLVELVNIHDSSIVFEPIHRVILGTDTGEFMQMASACLEGISGTGGASRAVKLVSGGEEKELSIACEDISVLIDLCEEIARDYAQEKGGRLDYIHDDAAIKLGREPGNAAIILPAMDKSELFPTIIRSGAFPRKSFSIGFARDKRYYLEARRIR